MTPITSFYFRNPWEPLGILGTYCSWKSNFILGTLGICMNPGNPMYRNCMTPVITWNPLKLLRILWVLWTILLVLNSVKNCVCKHNQSKMNMDEPSWTFMNYDRTKRYFSSENKRIYLFLLRKEHIDLKFLEKLICKRISLWILLTYLKKWFLFQIKEENGLGISHRTPSRNTSTKRERSLSEKQGRNAKERTNQNGKTEEQWHW